MLVILAGDQLLSPQKICPGCLLADRSGNPRWHDGRLSCGDSRALNATSNQQIQCSMGFQVVEIAD